MREDDFRHGAWVDAERGPRRGSPRSEVPALAGPQEVWIIGGGADDRGLHPSPTSGHGVDLHLLGIGHGVREALSHQSPTSGLSHTARENLALLRGSLGIILQLLRER